MKRRKFLLGAGSAAAAGSALIGSGAFSEVRAQRQVTIQVAEDPNAYLGMDDCIGRDGEPTENSSFADLDDDGHLRVDMGPSGTLDGSGVNSDSISWFDNVFQICNQGKECVGLWIDEKRGPDPGRVKFYVDSGNPPTRYVEDDLVTRERVQNDGGLQELGNSEEDAIRLDLGECVCVGIQTYTRDDDSFEIPSPAEGDQLINGVTIAADVNSGVCDTPTPECPELTGEYLCTVYADDAQEGNRRTGTRFGVENTGDVGVGYDLATNDSPGSWRGGLTIGANSSTTITSDASVPVVALVIWYLPPECEEQIEVEGVRWGDYKNGDNQFGESYDDLKDWYESIGEGTTAPSDAPVTLDNNKLVSELNAIPQTEEPDEFISDEQFPNMTQAAEDAGWITCTKRDTQQG